MTGAWVEFRGLVRGEEDGRPIAALEYEAYAPMAESEARRILADLAGQYPLLSARVVHRLGVVPVGETALYVGVACRHRAEAFATLTAFLERLKREVPIWKRPVWREEATTRSPLATTASPANPTRAGEGNDPPAKRTDTVEAGPAPSVAHCSVSPDEVVRLLRNICRPLEPERVPLTRADGRVLRESVGASEDQPPFDRSAVDGYAVRLDDPASTFCIVDEIRAGDWKPRALRAGEAVAIATGAALPGDGLQVVMREHTERDGDALTVLCRDRERHIRFRGEEARAGQTLVEAGTRLESGTLALLASLGWAHPLVTRPPRVGHLVTGNELAPPDQPLKQGQVRDSNSVLVRAFLQPWDPKLIQRFVPEDEHPAREALRDCLAATEEIDLLLISGGASVGHHDFTPRLLAEAGFVIHVRRTTARPGKPLIVAQRGKVIAFGLPGNPLAHFVCLNLYVRTALEVFSGCGTAPLFRTGVLAADAETSGDGRETFAPARLSFDQGRALLTPLRWSGSGDLTPLATANALIRVRGSSGRLERGSAVEFVPTGNPA